MITPSIIANRTSGARNRSSNDKPSNKEPMSAGKSSCSYGEHAPKAYSRAAREGGGESSFIPSAVESVPAPNPHSSVPSWPLDGSRTSSSTSRVLAIAQQALKCLSHQSIMFAMRLSERKHGSVSIIKFKDFYRSEFEDGHTFRHKWRLELAQASTLETQAKE